MFEGKVAMVTGGATGIGRVGAQLFAREGAKVVVATGRNVAGGKETVELIKKAGGEACFVSCDVSNEADVRAMVDDCVKVFSGPDYAFNNADVGLDGIRIPFYNIVDCPEEVWDQMPGPMYQGACEFVFCKHPEDIPEEFYLRIGKKKPKRWAQVDRSQ